MSSRRIPPHYGQFPDRSAPPTEFLEDKIAMQAAEIERLAGDNHRLATSHITMREDLYGAQQEIPRLDARIRSIHTESDIQIRVLLDKIVKMEAEIKAGERLKKDLQQAHIEAQSLNRARQELTSKIQQASEELHKASLEVKCLPNLHAELESLKQEHQRLRATFQFERGANLEKVEQLQAMEKNLIEMTREMEKLRAEVINAETRAQAPNPYSGTYSGTYMNPNPSYPPPVEGGGMYVDGYGQSFIQMGVAQTGEGMHPYGNANGVAGASGVVGAAVPATAVGAYWGGPNVPSYAQR